MHNTRRHPSLHHVATFSLTACSAVALFAAPAESRANHIDFFVDAPFTSVDPLGDTNEVVGLATNILGTKRTYTTFNSSFTGTVSASLASGGPLKLSDAGGALGTYTFGFGTESLTGTDLNANFVTGAGYDSILFSLPRVLGSGTLDVFIRSAGDSYNFTPQAINGAGDYYFPYSEVLTAIPTFDINSVDAFSFMVSSLAPNSEFDISGVTREVIPEPGSATLLLTGLIGVTMRRRRMAA